MQKIICNKVKEDAGVAVENTNLDRVNIDN